MSKASPSFQFYPTDLAPHVDPLNMEERGVYLTLMRYLWSSGPMPIDEAEALIGKPWLSCGLILRRKFIESDGTICLEWMEEQREKQATFRRLQAEKGKKGGRPKSSEATSTKPQKPSLNRSLTESKPNESPRVGVGVGNGVGIGEGNSGKGSRGKDHVHEPEIIPAGVTPAMWSAIKRWAQYRKEKKSKLTPTGMDAFVKKCVAMGEARSVAAIEHSIAQGWTGMYEPQQDRTNGSESIADKAAGVLDILRAGRL